MIEEYIFKTIISFISLNAVFYMTKDNWLKAIPKRNGFIKVMLGRLSFCLIPVIRWVWVVLALIIGIALGNDEFAKKVREKNEDDNESI